MRHAPIARYPSKLWNFPACRAATALVAALAAHLRAAQQKCPAAGAELSPEAAVMVRSPCAHACNTCFLHVRGLDWFLEDAAGLQRGWMARAVCF